MKYLSSILILLYSSAAFPCSMLLKENIHWGEKVKEFEDRAISKSIEDSDSILIVRALDWSLPAAQKKNSPKIDEAPEIILGGRNPNAGKIRTIHKVKVLKVIKGSHKEDEDLTVNILEPENFGGGGGDGDRCWEPAFSYVNVEPMDNTFKYLIYLNGSNVLRQNRFVEWHKDITADEELERIKK